MRREQSTRWIDTPWEEGGLASSTREMSSLPLLISARYSLRRAQLPSWDPTPLLQLLELCVDLPARSRQRRTSTLDACALVSAGRVAAARAVIRGEAPRSRQYL